MQMKIGVVGFGAGIPKTNLGIGVLNMAKLYFRHSLVDKNIVRLQINDLISLGGKSGSFIFSGFRTKWFDLNPQNDSWARNSSSLLGKKVQLELSGVVAMWGGVDVTLTLFNKYNEGKDLVKQCCVEADRGIQFSNMKVQGTIAISKI